MSTGPFPPTPPTPSPPPPRLRRGAGSVAATLHEIHLAAAAAAAAAAAHLAGLVVLLSFRAGKKAGDFSPRAKWEAFGCWKWNSSISSMGLTDFCWATRSKFQGL